MSNKLVAENVVYFSVFSLLFFHSLVNILFFFNKVKSTSYLKDLNENITFPDTIFKGVLDIKLVNQTIDCELVYKMNEMNFTIWPGTYEGVYIQSNTYKKKCTFKDCTGVEKIDGYVKEKCNTTKFEGDPQTCCNFVIDTPFPEKCYASSEMTNYCYCPDIYQRKDDHKYKNTIDRNVTILPSINQTPLARFNGKKICSNFITNYSLFDTICEGGKYCFNYICLKNVTTCPDYSVLNNFNPKKAISDISFSYNSVKCSSMNKTDKIDTSEMKHYLSKLYSINNSGCNYSMTDKYDEDVLIVNSINSAEHYKHIGLYDKILYNIDRLTKNDEFAYHYKLVDDIYITASSHFSINLSKQTCRNSLIFSKIDFAINTAKDIINGWVHTIIVVINAILLIIICCVSGLYFLKLKQKNNNISLLRFIILAQVIFFAFNLTVFLINNNEDKKINSINNLVEMKGCFYSISYNSFLKKLEHGIRVYEEYYSNSLKKIMIENSIILLMIILVLSPLMGLFTILGFKKIK